MSRLTSIFRTFYGRLFLATLIVGLGLFVAYARFVDPSALFFIQQGFNFIALPIFVVAMVLYSLAARRTRVRPKHMAVGICIGLVVGIFVVFFLLDALINAALGPAPQRPMSMDGVFWGKILMALMAPWGTALGLFSAASRDIRQAAGKREF